jgi:hypothetical protein
MINADELKRLMGEATPGPWRVAGDARSPDIYGPKEWAVALGECAQNCGYIHWNNLADADLICAAVNALPELLAMAEENARLREALKPFAEARLESWGQRTQGVGDYLTRVWINTAPNVAVSNARAALKEPGQ